MEGEIAKRRTATLAGHLETRNFGSEFQLESSECAAKIEMKTLEDERANCPFDVRTLTYLLDGGEKYTKLKELIALEIERDPILNDGLKRYDLTREESRVLCTQKFFRMAEMIRGKDEEYIRAIQQVVDLFDASLGMRWFVQWHLWIGTISNQGTPEQQKKWLDGARELKIIGCFGMTELGHSSFLRGAETTATFEEKTDEFVIHSPTVTSTKWWIGLAGQIATHCIVFANLFSKGKPCGIQLFIVPLRDPKTGLPFPGVSLGDLGSKYGRNGLDNGWIQFTNVRIPRENMLGKWAQVSRSGVFTPPPNPALAYGSTITERVSSVLGTVGGVDQALTVAVRYSAIRRQGSGNPQILDFQTQQYRLIPLIAGSYAIHFTGLRIGKVYEKMLSDLQRGDADGFLRPLADVHNTSCGLKAFCTWWGTEALELCRRALGGHGYSQYSSIPRLIGDFGVMTTGGGDNIVIAQQTASYLLKTLQSAMSGKTEGGPSVAYIIAGLNSEDKSLQANSIEDLFNTKLLLEAFQSVALKQLKEAASRVQEEVSEGKSMKEAWNNCQNDLVDAVQAHIGHYILESFVEAINNLRDASLKVILTKLCHLFALRTIQQQIGSFVEYGYINDSQISLVRKAVVHLCKEIRKVAVPLIDAFNIQDVVLNSPLGRKDGDIYDKYLDAVKGSRNGYQKTPYWDDLVKPHVENQSQSASSHCCGSDTGCKEDCTSNCCK